MIIKRTRGVSASAALAYDYGPGKAQEHHSPHRVAGTAAGRDWRDRARRMDAQQREYGDNNRGEEKRVIRLAVCNTREDRTLSDREWSLIAHQVVDGYTKGRAEQFTWEAVRHDRAHIHITLLQRDVHGKLCSRHYDGQRMMRTAKRLEKEHGLGGPGVARDKALDPNFRRSLEPEDTRTWRAAQNMRKERGTLKQQRERAAERAAALDAKMAEAARRYGFGELPKPFSQLSPVEQQRAAEAINAAMEATHTQAHAAERDRPEQREQPRQAEAARAREREPDRPTGDPASIMTETPAEARERRARERERRERERERERGGREL